MDERIWEEAIAWQAAQARDDCDWTAFTEWLEADVRHRTAFDEVALLDDSISRARPQLANIVTAEEAQARKPAGLNRRWAGVGLGAVAATIAAVTVPMFATGGGQIAYNTGPGETRLIALADGSHVQLAAASSLIVDKADGNEMTLEGAAWFDVPHNPARSLVIHAGNFQVTDIGTKFEIDTGGHNNLRVSVAEGSLAVKEGGLPAPVSLKGGQRLMIAGDFDIAEVKPIDSADVGSWRNGRLVYQDAPLSLVAADISRYARTNVTVDPAIAGRRFSGVLTIGDGSGLVGNLQQFMGLAAHRENGGIRLVARSGS